ncbi:protoglobin domain-containing protein [Bradyrhizobium sp. Gha]|uniref:protoglobin domain-containing protein n=1 Tax=Bradyrhizobium sp. Gha TaxID=1855318 RepID=UPI0008E34BAA|nr:protoglobin domain-containing protein [Bradyrhizobium sp. Gha]SFJ45120.1 Protoglobin [Bradyrhizobium sp. Gha]
MMTQIIRYLRIDTRTQLLAEQLWNLAEGPSSQIIAEFYRRTRQSHPGVLLDEHTVSRLMIKQREHWHSLFNSRVDQAYLRRATKVGIMHHEVGLDPKWYVAGYALMKAGLAEQLLFDASIPLRSNQLSSSRPNNIWPSTWRLLSQAIPTGSSTSCFGAELPAIFRNQI